ncbi:MAG: beta-Ala-His dipeptidase [Bacillota bacterium]
MIKEDTYKYDNIFNYFKEISSISRISGKEEKISEYLLNFAKKNKLECFRDQNLNVIIKGKNYKVDNSKKEIILQSHMDMVYSIDPHSDFKIGKDSINLMVDREYIKAKKTSLGADNGIGMAIILSILENNKFENINLKAIFTSKEEKGMAGAKALNPKYLKGDILINLDSQNERELITSSSGGVTSEMKISKKFKDKNFDGSFYKIIITGLKGGHSGLSINKPRANAIKLMSRLLKEIKDNIKFDLAFIKGGEEVNTIAKCSEAIIHIQNSDRKKLAKILDDLQKTFNLEYELNSDIRIYIRKIEENLKIYEDDLIEKIINLIHLLPQGVNQKTKEFVQASSNISKVYEKEKEIIFKVDIRSFKDSFKKYLKYKLNCISSLINCKLEFDLEYPAWNYQSYSKIRNNFKKTYESLFNQKINLTKIHAGLECSVFKEKNPKLDIISIGPDIYDANTTNEKVSIESINRIYILLSELLKKI